MGTGPTTLGSNYLDSNWEMFHVFLSAEKAGYKAVDLLKYVNKQKNTPLHAAINGGDLEVSSFQTSAYDTKSHKKKAVGTLYTTTD